MAGKIVFAFDKNVAPLVMMELGLISSRNALTIGLEELAIMSLEFQSSCRNTLTLGLGRPTRRLQPTSLT